MNGKLYLIPVPVSEQSTSTIPVQTIEKIKTIENFLVEDVRTARRFLSSLKIFSSIETLQFEVLNKDTKEQELKSLLSPLLIKGKDIGILSESGAPGIADPGAIAVSFAHQRNIKVVPLVGPSSILLALMASGLNGQQFAFHGYLPIEGKEAGHRIKELEKESKTKHQTQIFIETPYRNTQLFNFFLKNLSNDTLLTIAIDLTGSHEFIQTKEVSHWKKESHQWPKEPAVFLFLA